jgi:hypothetical protein
MPAQYEAMRDKFISKGMSTKAAKTRAAKIYNSRNSDKPVGPNYEKKKKRRKQKAEYPRSR